MNFESLPNEIILGLFDYFNGIELLRTFYSLNSRFNHLLHDRFPSCSFEFNSISKYDFDVICQNYLPSTADYITDLTFSNNEETPTQIQLFLSYGLSFTLFFQLRSLSLFCLCSYEILLKILEECHDLPNLSHLYLNYCYFQDSSAEFQSITNHIWSLSKLVHCTIGIGIRRNSFFSIPTKVSSSLVSLSIESVQIKLDQVNQLFEKTPNLRQLSVSIQSFINNNYIPTSLPNLLDLTINSLVTCSASRMSTWLQNTPNLHRLSVDLSSELVDGNQWKELIRNCLPKLQVFQFRMKTSLSLEQNIENRVVDLIDSFRSPFWIDEHQWFVRCLTRERTINLHSLSSCYEEHLSDIYHSTCPYDDQENFYNSITTIASTTFTDESISSHIRLPNIQYLCVNLPINERFWSIFPTFNRLKSLKIQHHRNAFQPQVQALLNRAPYLNSLIIDQYDSTPLQISLFKYTNVSIRQLCLKNIKHYFNEEECITLSRSPLGVQCEKLSILVDNCQSIVSLVENMPKLRSLNVRCKDESCLTRSMSMENTDVECSNEYKDDDLEWLRTKLPSICTVVRNLQLSRSILVWT